MIIIIIIIIIMISLRRRRRRRRMIIKKYWSDSSVYTQMSKMIISYASFKMTYLTVVG